MVHALQGISNAAYACAVLGRQHGALLAGLSLAVERQRPLLSPQQLVNTAWAIAKLEAHLPETMASILNQLTHHHIGSVNAQDTANMLWALARLDCVPRQDLLV